MIDEAIVRTRWQQVAADYDQSAFIQQEIGRGLLARLSYMRLSPKRVLNASWHASDIAAGLQAQFPDAEHVALSDPALLTALPFADHSIDCYLANLSLCWLNDYQQAIAEMRRVLTPGGMLLFTTYGVDTLQELRASFAAMDHTPRVMPFIDMHHIGDALLQQGFKDPVMDLAHLTFRYPRLQQLFQDLRMTGANNALQDRVKHLTTPRQWQRMLVAYEQFKIDGQYPATFEVVTGHAWAPSMSVSQDASSEVVVSVDQITGLSR